MTTYIKPALQQNMIIDEVESRLPTDLYHYLFQKNKTPLPTDCGHHFPRYMKMKRQEYYQAVIMRSAGFPSLSAFPVHRLVWGFRLL
jgi:hypothetical protein